MPQLNERLAARAVALVQGLRELDLRKNPGISETIDWARALVALQAETLDRRTLERTLSVLLKHEQDLQRARRRLSRPASGSTARGEPGPHSD